LALDRAIPVDDGLLAQVEHGGDPGNGGLEVVVEALSVVLLLDDPVEHLGVRSLDRAEQQALTLQAGAGLCDGAADGHTVASVGGDEGGVDAVAAGERQEVVRVLRLEATGAREHEGARGVLLVRHLDPRR
jgi:hypothetical protein